MFKGLRLFSVRGIPIFLHWSAVLILALVGFDIGQVAGPGVAVAAAAAFLGSILAHELAHAMVASHYGVATERITLWGLGGLAQLRNQTETPRAEAAVAAAGPAMSAALGVVGVATALALHGAGVRSGVTGVVFWLGLTNGILAVFNVLPGAPLDGGRLVTAWRWATHGDRYRAREEAAQAGQVVGLVVVAVGVWLMLRGIGNLVLPMTGLFIGMNAAAERRGAQLAHRLDGLRVGDLTWYGVAQASGDTDTATMVWQRGRLGAAGVVAVTDAGGHLTGVVCEDRMLKVPEHLRSGVRLSQLMVPITALARAQADESLVSALSRVNPVAPVVTVWRDGRLVGVVPTERVRQRIDV